MNALEKGKLALREYISNNKEKVKNDLEIMKERSTGKIITDSYPLNETDFNKINT
jgi:hypothetical protein